MLEHLSFFFLVAFISNEYQNPKNNRKILLYSILTPIIAYGVYFFYYWISHGTNSSYQSGQELSSIVILALILGFVLNFLFKKRVKNPKTYISSIVLAIITLSIFFLSKYIKNETTTPLNENLITLAKKPEIDCSKEVYVEKTKLCIPNINGFTNHNDDLEFNLISAKLSSLNNDVLTVYKDNSIENSDFGTCAFYVNNTTKMDISNSQFTSMSNEMGKYLSNTDFIEKIKKDFFSNDFNAIPNNVTSVVDEYNMDNKSKTYIILMKKEQNGEDIMTITSLNFIHVKSKMVISNYVSEYVNEKSMIDLKEKNKKFIIEFLQHNES